MSAQRIVAGYVRRAHGIRGDVVVRSLSDDPARFAVGSTFLTDEEPPRTLVVARARSHADGELLGFASISDRTTAETLQGASLTITMDERRELGEGEFWPDELVGLTAVDSTGSPLGTVTDVVLLEAQDRLVVTTPDGERVDVPFVDALVGKVDPERREIAVRPPEGLFPD